MWPSSSITRRFTIQTRVTRWWWRYPTPSEGWGRGGTPRRPNNWAPPTMSGPEITNERSSAKDWRGSDLHQRLAASTRWCDPRPSLERWAEMVRQLPRGVRPSGRPQSSAWLGRFASVLSYVSLELKKMNLIRFWVKVGRQCCNSELILICMFSHKIQSFSKLLIFSRTVGTVSVEITDADSYVKGNFVMLFEI